MLSRLRSPPEMPRRSGPRCRRPPACPRTARAMRRSVPSTAASGSSPTRPRSASTSTSVSRVVRLEKKALSWRTYASVAPAHARTAPPAPRRPQPGTARERVQQCRLAAAARAEHAREPARARRARYAAQHPAAAAARPRARTRRATQNRGGRRSLCCTLGSPGASPFSARRRAAPHRAARWPAPAPTPTPAPARARSLARRVRSSGGRGGGGDALERGARGGRPTPPPPARTVTAVADGAAARQQYAIAKHSNTKQMASKYNGRGSGVARPGAAGARRRVFGVRVFKGFLKPRSFPRRGRARAASRWSLTHAAYACRAVTGPGEGGREKERGITRPRGARASRATGNLAPPGAAAPARAAASAMAHRRAAAACAPSRALVLALACSRASRHWPVGCPSRCARRALAGAADVTIDGAAAVALVAAHARRARRRTCRIPPRRAASALGTRRRPAHRVALTRERQFRACVRRQSRGGRTRRRRRGGPLRHAALGYLQDPVALNGASSVSLYGGYAYVAARGARNLPW